MSEIEHDALPMDLLPGDRCRWDDPPAGPVEAALAARIDAWLRGGAFEGIAAQARAAGRAGPLAHSGGAPDVAPRVLPDEELADIVEDWLPEVGLFGERVTGDPWAPVTPAVAAALALVPGLCRGKPVIEAWIKDSHDRAGKHAARVVSQSPPQVFAFGQPLLRVAPGWSAPPPGPHGVGRPYRVGEGWAWSGWMPLPSPPDPGPLRRRLRAAAWLRARAPGLTVEALLRAVPDVVYRAAHEGSWRAGERACG